MKEIFRECYDGIDAARMMRRTEELWRAELGQTFPCYRRAAEVTRKFLEEDGFADVELLEFPADGKTSFQDKRMPLAWDATVGRLTLLSSSDTASANAKIAPSGTVDNVVADFARHPFHLVKGSVSTPKGGVVARLMTEAQFFAGNDARGALVILEPETWPRRNMLTPILDRGGLGFVTDLLIDRFATPDGITWVNACTETNNWHVDCETRDFIGFAVSPRTGTRLRTLAAEGDLRARVECDGRRYEGTVPLVTATVPGCRKEEYWLVAHLYEPLAADDSNGVVAAIETARRFIGGEKPEFTLRVVFGLEYYGFAAYAEKRGCPLRDRVIGACNYDSVASMPNQHVRLLLGGPATPFYGNSIFESAASAAKDIPDALEVRLGEAPEYFDDISLTDPTVGVGTIWPINGHADATYWHNSVMDMSLIDAEVFRRGTAFNAMVVTMTAVAPKPEYVAEGLRLAQRKLADAAEKATCAEHFDRLWEMERTRLSDFARFAGADALKGPLAELDAAHDRLRAGLGTLSAPIRTSPWRDYAAGIVPTRLTTGFLQDQVRVPKEKRIDLPDAMIYGPFANIVANMDGKKDLARLIREAEYERGVVFDEATVKRYVNAVCFLGDYGYFGIVNRGEIRQADIVAALRTAGVVAGDVLLVHSSLSAFGHIAGGAETVIAALKEAVGEKGTVLMPSFNRPYRILEDENVRWDYRPYAPDELSSLKWIGTLPIEFLRAHPDAARSAHLTHSWTGFGLRARELLSAHRPDDPPASPDSPLGKALEAGGKVLHFGSSLGATTFLHFLEDRFDLPGLGPALVGVRNPDGSTRDVFIPKHLPGDREFYSKGEDARFFREAKARGLKIGRAKLGLGELKLMDLSRLAEIGGALCKDDPRIILG